MLKLLDVQRLAAERKTAFNGEYWRSKIRNQSHFDLVARAKHPFDYRLLYDSWLWRQVLESLRPGGIAAGATVMELLPGASLTIPMALQSLNFCGTLVRINDEMPASLPNGATFQERWHACRVADLLSAPVYCDLVVGNHIVDDILFDMCYPNREGHNEAYSNPALCTSAWAAAAKSELMLKDQKEIIDIFLSLVRLMPSTSHLVLRHYPPTFALNSLDVTRVNVEMDTFVHLCEAAKRCPELRSYFVDVESLNAPSGSKYPQSVLVLSVKSPRDRLDS